MDGSSGCSACECGVNLPWSCVIENLPYPLQSLISQVDYRVTVFWALIILVFLVPTFLVTTKLTKKFARIPTDLVSVTASSLLVLTIFITLGNGIDKIVGGSFGSRFEFFTGSVIVYILLKSVRWIISKMSK